MSLPDELWMWILELGVETSCLTYKGLCCLAMTSRRLNRLSEENVLWSKLLSSDFPTHPSSSTNPSSKSLYQIRFEKDKVKKLLAERRAVLRIESQIHEHTRKIYEIEARLVQEDEKIKSAIAELKNLQNVRVASTALKAKSYGSLREFPAPCKSTSIPSVASAYRESNPGLSLRAQLVPHLTNSLCDSIYNIVTYTL